LPKRHGRNEDPVGKHAKAAKVAKTKATKEAKVADKQRQEADAENAKEKLADMEIDKSFAQAQEAQQRIRRQSDMEIMTQSDDSEGRSVNNVESSDKVSEAAADETQQLRKKLGPKVSFD
jgi:hypothetical protein